MLRAGVEGTGKGVILPQKRLLLGQKLIALPESYPPGGDFTKLTIILATQTQTCPATQPPGSLYTLFQCPGARQIARGYATQFDAQLKRIEYGSAALPVDVEAHAGAF